tara:strand:+ start:104 stop:568 length:465 start_codon:yes stop_codon:yes gene_type:complete
MAAGEYDISAEQGSTVNLSMTYKDSADAVIDLASYTARMQVRRSMSDNQVLLDLSGTTGSHSGVGVRGSLTGGGSTGEFTVGVTYAQTGTGGIRLNTSSTGGTGHTGGIIITIDAVSMANCPSGNHVYDLELVTGATVDRILQGKFEVVSEVTR